MSMPNTRWRRCAQVIPARRSAGVRSSVSAAAWPVAPSAGRLMYRHSRSRPIQRIVHRDQRVDIDGNGFSAIARLKLNQFLQTLCREAGVNMTYSRSVASLAELGEAELIVGADGVNSLVRRSLSSEFQPRVEWLTNKFAWYGTPKVFDCLTLTFRTNEHGAWVAHHYRYSPSMSTFLVECDAATWQRAGLEAMSDEHSRAYCERVFAPDLDGQPLGGAHRRCSAPSPCRTVEAVVPMCSPMCSLIR